MAVQRELLRGSTNKEVRSLVDDASRTNEGVSPGGRERAVRILSGAPELYRRIGRGVAATDVISIFFALLVAYLIRWGPTFQLGYAVVMAITPVVWFGIFRSQSLYSPQLMSSWDEFRRMLLASSLGLMFLVFLSFAINSYLSRLWLVIAAPLMATFLLLTRRAWHGKTAALKKQGKLSLRTLIVGSGKEGRRLARALSVESSGFRPIGFVATQPSSSHEEGLPLLGGIHDLVELIYDHGVDCLFLADPNVEQKDMMHMAQVARQQGAEIRLSANLPEILTSRVAIQPLEGIMTLTVKPVRLTGGQVAIKRMFDVVVGGILFLVGLPLLAAIALIIKLDSKGPVLFRQHRVTKGGHIFKMFKFRTMTHDADDYLKDSGIDPSVPFFKLKDQDPRLTRAGKFLRRLSLDELPQLLNVLKGEMSLVGPRPLPADQVAANLDMLGPRHEVPAGVSGWWQIQGRSEIGDPDEAVRMDLFYIENWSLALDLFILLKTLSVVLTKRGAY